MQQVDGKKVLFYFYYFFFFTKIEFCPGSKVSFSSSHPCLGEIALRVGTYGLWLCVAADAGGNEIEGHRLKHGQTELFPQLEGLLNFSVIIRLVSTSTCLCVCVCVFLRKEVPSKHNFLNQIKVRGAILHSDPGDGQLGDDNRKDCSAKKR